MDIYKDIEGYEGLYKVCSNGAILRTYKNNKVRQLKPLPNKKRFNYESVSLSKSGNVKRFYVHRLVAVAFIPNPLKKPQVNHIDGNVSNNSMCNLQWCTNSENQIHSYRNLGKKPVRPRMRAVKQFKGEELIGIYDSVREAERQCNIDGSSISKVCKGKYKSTNGYRFEYV